MRLSRREALLSASATALGAFLPQLGWAQQETPKRGGVLTAHLSSEQRILNPALRASTVVYIITSKIMEALVDLDAKGSPVGVLATAWEASPDGKTITFKLREGVNWHDGKPFTSADVQYTALEMWKKHLNYGTQLQQYLEAVDTPDAHTAVFRYSRPMPLNLLLRALCDLGYIAPRHVFEGTQYPREPREHGADRHGTVQVRPIRARPVHRRRAQPELLAQGVSLSRPHRLARHHRQVRRCRSARDGPASYQCL